MQIILTSLICVVNVSSAHLILEKIDYLFVFDLESEKTIKRASLEELFSPIFITFLPILPLLISLLLPIKNLSSLSIKFKADFNRYLIKFFDYIWNKSYVYPKNEKINLELPGDIPF